MPTVLDLTHAIAPGMPCYPGTEPPVFSQPFTVAEHGFAERRLTMLTHTGTHVDAPAHMLDGAATLDAFAVGRFMGRAAVVDVSGAPGGAITRQALQDQLHDIDSLDYVLLHTGWADRWGDASYYRGFPVLNPEAARWLAGSGLHGLGIDAVSVDAAPVDATATAAAETAEFPIHRILLQRGLVIVENLTGLRELVGRRLTFLCLPLKIAGADGAPARALAWLD